MKITPNSTLYLLKNVPLDINNNFTLDFNNINQQNNFFDNLIYSTFDINEGYSYIRDTQTLKVQANCDDLFGINYLYFMNNNKRYYAFITKKDYINPNCTAISFKIDVLQSFMFDYSIDESFVEREHQDRLKKGTQSRYLPIYNTKQENINYGDEYVVNKLTDSVTLGTSTPLDYYLIISKEPLHNALSDNNGTLISGIETSTFIYLGSTRTSGVEIISSRGNETGVYGSIYMHNEIYQNPNILSIKPLLNYPDAIYWDNENHRLVIDLTKVKGDDASLVLSSEYVTLKGTSDHLIYFNIVTTLLLQSTSYVNLENKLFYDELSINNPKNIKYETKLDCYPYSFMRFNLMGKYKNYHIDRLNIDYDSTNYKFKYILGQSLNINGGVVAKVDNDSNFSDDILISKLPELNLKTDAWQNYLLNNRASINGGLAVNLGTSLLSAGLGLATGGVGLAFAGGQAIGLLGQVANEMLKRDDIKNQPDEMRTASDDISTLSMAHQLKSWQLVTIKDEYKQAIFNYFYRFGYKCNDFKKPNVKSRYYFNYIKTIGANIKSNIDNDFITEIRTIFDNGITIWHYRDSNSFKGVNNYDYENVELSLTEVTQ